MLIKKENLKVKHFAVLIITIILIAIFHEPVKYLINNRNDITFQEFGEIYPVSSVIMTVILLGGTVISILTICIYWNTKIFKKKS